VVTNANDSNFFGNQAGYGATGVLIQISFGLAGYEATNASFQISLVLTLVKTHQVLVNQISLLRWL
jgi:hypothetical protein